MANTLRRPLLPIEFHRGFSLLTLAYMGGIAWLSLRPEFSTEPTDPRLTLVSNLLHIPAYAGLTYCLLKTVRVSRAESPWATTMLALLVTATFAAVNESAQRFVPGRYASTGDFVMDLLGMLCVVVALRLPIQHT